MSYISVILLCGGKGTRMGSITPKQYLEINNKMIALYGFDFFCALEEVAEIIVVCEEEYKKNFKAPLSKTVKFATPGKRRQDSVYNGLQKIDKKADIVCIHDGARPFLKKNEVRECFSMAREYGAAILGNKVQNTLKSIKNNFIEKTLPRDFLYEIYTPQVFKKDILEMGFDFAIKNNLTVTDDAALIENIQKQIRIVEGSKDNIKITTPFDLQLAKIFAHEKAL